MKGETRAEERLCQLLEIGEACNLENPNFNSQKFLWVFGNLIQEYLADRIFELVRKHNDIGSVVRSGLQLTEQFLGKKPQQDWPFHVSWIKEYLERRYLGKRKGLFQRDKRYGNVIAFKKEKPQDESSCE